MGVCTVAAPALRRARLRTRIYIWTMIRASIAVSVIGNAAHAVNDTLTPLLAAAATRNGARLRTRSQSASDGDHRPPHVHGSGLGSEHAKDICRAAERADPQPRLPARATGSARRCAAGPSPTRRRRRETGAGVGRTAARTSGGRTNQLYWTATGRPESGLALHGRQRSLRQRQGSVQLRRLHTLLRAAQRSPAWMPTGDGRLPLSQPMSAVSSVSSASS